MIMNDCVHLHDSSGFHVHSHNTIENEGQSKLVEMSDWIWMDSNPISGFWLW